MDIALLTIRLFLAGVFAVAGLAKFADPTGSKKAVEDFGVPASLSGPFSFVLPIAEIAAALGFVFTQSAWYASVAGSIMLFGFTAGMVYQLARGNAPDCHCFGQIHSEPVGKVSLVRNVILLGLSAVLVIAGRTVQGTDLFAAASAGAQYVVALLVAGLLLVVLYVLLKLLAGQKDIVQRLEVIELDALGVERHEAGHPDEGLPIGAIFPDFELPALDGSVVSLAKLRGDGVPIIFLFVSPTCSPCKALLPELDAWRTGLAGRATIALVSTGTLDDNLAAFPDEKAGLLLLQTNRELADQVMARWTPTALFVDSDGRIASHAAAGDAAIRSLVAKVVAADLDDRYQYFANGGDPGLVKIGGTVPKFSLTDLDGETIGPDHFSGKPTLVTFWSTTCPHCSAMMDEIREWERTRTKDSPELAVFADGDREAFRSLGIGSRIVIDPNYSTGALFGMQGTPSAVLIDENGRFASETAVGARAIWSLIGKRK